MNVWEFGQSGSDVRLIARRLGVPPLSDYVIVARGEYPGVYQIWLAPAQYLQTLIFQDSEPSPFPYGFAVEPDHP